MHVTARSPSSQGVLAVMPAEMAPSPDTLG
jgi:hypothetical protein